MCNMPEYKATKKHVILGAVNYHAHNFLGSQSAWC